MKKQVPRVAVLVDTSTTWGREVTEGVLNYVRSTHPWHLYLRATGFREKRFLSEGWKCDGIIARVNSRAAWKRLQRVDCPVVNVSGVEIKGVDLPRVILDEDACADMAVRHLKELGLTHFAHYVEPRQPFTRQRRQTFIRAFNRADLSCALYRRSPAVRSGASWADLRNDLRQWLRQLPKPVGITCWGHFQARELVELCLESGLMIPHDVAILGIASDRLLSTAVPPTLSEVNLQSGRQGFLAARMLDRIMQGRKLDERAIILPPLGITVHESTDMRTIADPLIRKALGFIWAHIDRPITVNDVLEEVLVSRRGLERRFQALLNRSPAREIQRARLDKTRRLLKDTHLSMPKVADASGWTYVEYMISVFKKEVGLTPLQYRKQVQSRL